MKPSPPHLRAFTLIEMLTVVSVIAILATLILTAVGSFQRKAGESKEISNARQVIAAYLTYAGDNNGELMPGYGDFPATDERGVEVNNPVNKRYPWRLAPYLGYDMRIVWGTNGDDNLRKLATKNRDEYIYGVSVQPALGLNAMYVGGDYDIYAPDNPKALQKYGFFCVTRLAHAAKPASLIVFASASSGFGKDKLTGYFKVEAPYTTARKWSGSLKADEPAAKRGYVDFRYNDRAVVAMLDGHVEVLDFAQMNDMRRWSNQAAEADDPNFLLGKKY